jgi:hypothetical protein
MSYIRNKTYLEYKLHVLSDLHRKRRSPKLEAQTLWHGLYFHSHVCVKVNLLLLLLNVVERTHSDVPRFQELSPPLAKFWTWNSKQIEALMPLIIECLV